MGDALLVAVAGRLQRRLRTTDLIARRRGDEFAIVLPHTPGWAARLVAEQLLDAIRALEGGATTASGGIAGYSRATATVTELLTTVEGALQA